MNSAKASITKIFNSISTTSPTQQLIVGAASGWVSGFVTIQAGKTAAFIAGPSIILVQLAENQGLVEKPWQRARDKLKSTRDKMVKDPKKGSYVSQVQGFATNNRPFTAGFIGGFLLGAAT